MKKVVVLYPPILNFRFIHSYFNKLVARYIEQSMKRQMENLHK